MKKAPSIVHRIIGLHLLALVATSIVVSGATYFLLNSTINSYEQRILRDHAVVVAKPSGGRKPPFGKQPECRTSA